MSQKVALLQDIIDQSGDSDITIKAGTVLDLAIGSPFACTSIIYNGICTFVTEDQVRFIVDDDTLVQICTRSGLIFDTVPSSHLHLNAEMMSKLQGNGYIDMGEHVLVVLGAYVNFPLH